MKRAIPLALAAAVLAGGGYLLGRHGGHPDKPADAPASADAGRKVLYWHDPMFPQHKFDKPGKSPFMNMQLVPVYADEKQEAPGPVTVRPGVQQSLGLRTAVAHISELTQEVSAVGYVQADEGRIARAEVRATGWVERLHVRAVNDPVRAGQVLAEIYAPELLAAQEEYLLARRMAQANTADEALARAARRRVALLGVPETEIAKLERTGVANRRVPILAPISGVLSELGVREGAMVQAGTPAFTLTDLSSVWITLEVPETQAGMLRSGLRAQTRVQSLPGKVLEGRVDYVYPDLSAQTRTVRARVSLPNPGLALRPGMFADVSLLSAPRKVLTVPSEAVIHTGTRAVVIVMDGERFRAAAVKTGAEMNGRTEILEGLKAGERVVTSGQFLIDSEASLKGALERLENPAAPPVKSGMHQGRGTVTAVDATKGTLEIDHEPMPSLQWPRMTMEFAVPDKSALAKLKKGDAVEFEVRGEADKDGNYTIEKLAPRSRK